MPLVLNQFHRSNELIDLFRELGFTTGAEIGVSKGNYAKVLCHGIPNLKLYCVDPWQTYKGYSEINDQAVMGDIFEQAKKKLAGFNCKIIRKTSMEAVKNFEPNSLDFVFIDGNHDFEYVINDIISWMKVIRPGGILYGHDYHAGIADDESGNLNYAVQAYANAYKIWPWFVLRARRTGACWMWVKQ